MDNLTRRNYPYNHYLNHKPNASEYTCHLHRWIHRNDMFHLKARSNMRNTGLHRRVLARHNKKTTPTYYKPFHHYCPNNPDYHRTSKSTEHILQQQIYKWIHLHHILSALKANISKYFKHKKTQNIRQACSSSSLPSRQSFSLSHCQWLGMHLPLPQRNSFGEHVVDSTKKL